MTEEDNPAGCGGVRAAASSSWKNRSQAPVPRERYTHLPRWPSSHIGQLCPLKTAGNIRRHRWVRHHWYFGGLEAGTLLDTMPGVTPTKIHPSWMSVMLRAEETCPQGGGPCDRTLRSTEGKRAGEASWRRRLSQGQMNRSQPGEKTAQ